MEKHFRENSPDDFERSNLPDLPEDPLRPYPEFSEATIARAQANESTDPLHADILRKVTEQSEALNERALYKAREPKFHEAGWQIVLHGDNPRVACGLDANWLKDSFHLGYPFRVNLSDREIASCLNVPLEPHSEKLWIDRPAVQLSDNRAWLWKNNVGVVYTDRLPMIIKGREQELVISPDDMNVIYLTANPTNRDEEVVQSHRSSMLKLLALAAVRLNSVSRITVTYQDALIPEDLERENFENLTWLKGEPGDKFSQDKELVLSARRGDEEFLLKSATLLCPWVTTRSFSVPKGSQNVSALHGLLEESLHF